jgi:uncharacterized iron-regulated protein
MNMRINLSPLICTLILLTLTACTMTKQQIGNPEGPYPTAKPEVGDIYHLPTGVKVSAEQMQAAITDVRIVYVGETHDNPAAHRLELDVLKAMAERYPGQISLGMEMFNTGQQETLDQWTAGALSEKEFLKNSSWFSNWRMDYAYYRDILNYAREHQIPVVGLNATRELVKKVGRNSFESLDEETRSQLPEIDLDDPYQRAMAEAIYADHRGGKAMFDGFLRIQTLWDETMAENVVRVMQEKGPEHRMVVLAGGNHVRYGFGIPRRVYRRLPTSYMLVGVRELVIPNEKQGKLMDVKMPRFPMPSYDYLAFTEYESLPGERVKLGVRMKEEDGKVVVEGVVPGSTADQAGVVEGDVIVSMGDAIIADSFDLIYEVQQRISGDQTTLVVERESEKIKLDVTFAPLPKTDGHGMGKHKR